MAEQEEDLVAVIVGWIGTFLATYFFVSPVIPYIKVLKGEMKISDSPGILLICNMINTIIWTTYGLVGNTFQVYFNNCFGGSFTLLWISIYLIFLADKKIPMGILYISMLLILVTGFLYIFYFYVPYVVSGYIAMIFNILMYAAPGEKIVRVFKTKDYTLIPLFTTIGGLGCSLCWFIFGVYQNDTNIIVPNVLGLVFSIAQIVIYLVFKIQNKGKGLESLQEKDESDEKEEKEEKEEKMENGKDKGKKDKKNENDDEGEKNDDEY